MIELQEIPLFPLRSVLFPRGRLALQIFERRYIDLVTSSLKNNTGFGITLLKTGDEIIKTGKQQAIHRTGTYGRIVDWDQLQNGLLGITVEGIKKFRVDESWVADNDLFMGTVRFSEKDAVSEDKIPLDDEHASLSELLLLLEKHPAVQDMRLNIDYGNLWDLGWRLSELIPVTLEARQELLEVDDPWERIHLLEQAVHDLAYE